MPPVHFRLSRLLHHWRYLPVIGITWADRGGQGSVPPILAHVVGFLTLGSKLDPLLDTPLFSCRPNMDPLFKNPGSAPELASPCNTIGNTSVVGKWGGGHRPMKKLEARLCFGAPSFINVVGPLILGTFSL